MKNSLVPYTSDCIVTCRSHWGATGQDSSLTRLHRNKVTSALLSLSASGSVSQSQSQMVWINSSFNVHL